LLASSAASDVYKRQVREFLCSEAMHYLGVPTTRALSLTLTGDTVVRDMFYDGNAKPELGAVVCRVAPSFTRFGNFQLPASRGDIDLVKKLVDYTITTDFSDSFPGIVEPTKDNILQWYKEVSERTLEMVLHWMRVGFVHGVMNTDNMSILGLTIDYGPYGWLEDYDPTWTPNTTDATNRRYRFEHQPQIAHWNLLQLANTILPLVDDENSDEGRKVLEATLNQFAENYQARYLVMQLEKLGLKPLAEEQAVLEEKQSEEEQSEKEQSEKEVSNDAVLVKDLLTLLQSVETDMTLFYRCLAEVDVVSSAGLTSRGYVSLLADAYYQPDQLTEEYALQLHQWLERYAKRCESEGLTNIERKQIMNAINPLYVLRNYLSQTAIDKAEAGDFSGVEELMEVLKTPYTEQEGKSHLAQKRPEWARHRAGCSMLSCSS
ncbi:MAG: YdiU family protein, partial [Pseudomonadales bacterium]|nr:YdiU family protein [Pseudomonadales bacterium]